MRKLLIIIGSILMFCQAEAQVGSRCAVCPPTLRGVANGSVLRDSSGYARWQSVAGFDTAAIGVDSLSNLFWGLSGNSGTNPATNFLGTTDGQPLIIKSDSAIAANIGDSVFFVMGKKIPYQLAAAPYSGFKLVSSDTAGHWAGIYGLNSPTPDIPFKGFTVVGVMDSLNNFYTISEYAPGVMEHEIIVGDFNFVFKADMSGFNFGDYFSSNQYIQFKWDIGTWNIGANQWNNATIYGDTVANTITNICDGGFVVKNHSNADLALCDSLNIVIDDTVRITSNKPIKIGANSLTVATDGSVMVTESLTIKDGTQANGYVLTSDANGLASWQPNAAPTITSGVIAPASTPGKIGDIYVDTSAGKLYFAKGASSSADWIIAN